MTTHVGLVARAFGAQRLYLTEDDATVSASLSDVNQRFGGTFAVETVRTWRALLRQWPGPVVHLTMYGEPYADHAPALKSSAEPVLLIVGGAKVPGDVYGLATLNLAVGNQPHSEIAALAIVLHALLGDAHLFGDRPGAQAHIVPSPRGKVVLKTQGPSGPPKEEE